MYKRQFQSYMTAAAQGLPIAQEKVGLYYLNGQGTTTDAVAARAWLELAAKQNYPPAHARLAAMYEQGLGVQRNLKQAAELFAMASDRGFVPATLKLSTYYANGAGVEQDIVRAYVLAASVEEAGGAQAAELLGKIKGTMTEAQLADGDAQLAELLKEREAAAQPNAGE